MARAVKNSDIEVVEEEVTPVKSSKKITSLRDGYDVKKRAFTKRKVTITYNDKRDNNEVTDAYLTCENEFFSIARYVPSDMAVELEQCLIDTAKEARITTYRADLVKGTKSKSNTPIILPKYNVAYVE